MGHLVMGIDPIGVASATWIVENPEEIVAIEKSQWGNVNKVEMMRAALSYDNLKSYDLRWGFSDDLAPMVNFIRLANASC
ncbi:hypothetical protein ALO95_200321 [Pseudomonas syringae pv. antirrhini]|uniref:Uncharacterized protein n=1 Tax=Pseudomonas syringae pv. antirrhini TaxID=251702 RepID=A0A0N8QQB1_9PSED|nr:MULTISPECIES: hypothetical protein [Pseudomonas]KPW52694.1 Uncharacterized protein ALO88_00012 [Pseudomonas syringae pv. antirrhini]RMP32153.1 hypothetical protein ALQ24_03178 [Pseudomonas syringae pv. antirrhini]RMP42565.1 hypothetical protein ALQ23_200390 [Pseudomonas syringae pv. antirrhini]RMW23492.1 hypothetical protein ALO95_200321 [Pseudomonas syringae pv. antirrhini]WIN08850.1 hypothetical protein QQF68_08415 [Pseudomonas syringae pv. antirrhini str. 126]